MVLAVPTAMSNQGILSRYYEQLVDGGHGAADRAGQCQPGLHRNNGSCDAIDREQLADEVGVFRRGEATPRDRNALNAVGQWETKPTLRAAIESEREGAWTADETAGRKAQTRDATAGRTDKFISSVTFVILPVEQALRRLGGGHNRDEEVAPGSLRDHAANRVRSGESAR